MGVEKGQFGERGYNPKFGSDEERTFPPNTEEIRVTYLALEIGLASCRLRGFIFRKDS